MHRQRLPFHCKQIVICTFESRIELFHSESITLESFLDIGHSWQLLGVATQQGVHRHDKARSTESALGSMSFSQTLLDGVQSSLTVLLAGKIFRVADAFDGSDGHSVDSTNGCQTSVNSVMPGKSDNVTFVFIGSKESHELQNLQNL